MEIAGYIASLFVGIALGLLGGGGSILTVPVLVYLFHLNPVTAAAYSLFVVGTTSSVGAATKLAQKQADLKTAVVFGIPSIISIYLTRAYLVHAIPEVVGHLGNFALTRDRLLMLFFSIVMVFAAIKMIGKPKINNPLLTSPLYTNLKIIIQGLITGLIAGLVGAGGGFLIIPALVLLCQLPMSIAVGTSLVIIAANSIIGFLGDLGRTEMDWPFILTITGISIAGLVLGLGISKKMSGRSLRRGFGFFVLVLAAFIMIREVFLS